MSDPINVALRSFVYGTAAPYRHAGEHGVAVWVLRASVKAPFGIARKGTFVHRVATAAGTVEGNRVRFATRWICAGSGTTDAIFMTDPTGHRLCPNCEAKRDPLVYRCVAADGHLLYIGCTEFWPQRKRFLAAETWWPEVSEMRLEHWPDISAARQAEGCAIHDENPAFNVALRNRGAA